MKLKKVLVLAACCAVLSTSMAGAMSTIIIDGNSPAQVRTGLLNLVSGPGIRMNSLTDTMASFSDTVMTAGGFLNMQKMKLDRTADYTFTPDGNGGTLLTLSFYGEPVAVDGTMKAQRVKYPADVKFESFRLDVIKAYFNGIYRFGFNIDMAITDKSKGIVINGVTAGSPAEKAGLQAGDAIMKVDGKPAYVDKKTKMPVMDTPIGIPSTRVFSIKKKDKSTVQCTITSVRTEPDKTMKLGL
jgi:hypothetical protein